MLSVTKDQLSITHHTVSSMTGIILIRPAGNVKENLELFAETRSLMARGNDVDPDTIPT